MSTHYICFYGVIRKIFCGYPGAVTNALVVGAFKQENHFTFNWVDCLQSSHSTQTQKFH